MQEQKNTGVQTDLENKVMDYLKFQGYQAVRDARKKGKSGIDHSFDVVAQADDGVVNFSLAVCMISETGKESFEEKVFNFSNQAYDAGINQRIVVTTPELNRSAGITKNKHLRILTISEIDQLINTAKKDQKKIFPADGELKAESREQLASVLTQRGYRIEENARIRGRSGVEYTFDIVAYNDLGQFGYSVGIDFLSSLNEVKLEPISLFDTKAFDAGIDYKVIVANPRLSVEARQFTDLQHIRVFEVAPNSDITEKQLNTQEHGVSVRSQTLKKISPQPEALQLIPEVMARRYNAIPVSVKDNILEIAMVDATNIFALEAFASLSRKRVRPIAASSKDIRDAIDFNYKGYNEIEQQVSHISIPTGISDEKLNVDVASYTPLVQAVNMIIEEAAKAHSSDIHFEPEENRLRVRYRIDGTLQDMISLPLSIHRALISRLKILAGMNIADPHRPQDGQFTTVTKGHQLDVRVATAPTVYGEMAVLRLLDKTMAILELSELGFLPSSLSRYENMLKIPYGMILIGGPTGSGKTTTLYASVNTLDSMKRNIITIEDPAEYRLKDINQIQVNPQAGLTFATGLRSILRLDPDVIFVGEIRDGETANIAVQSALTGHMMLSSIHAGDTVGILSRLIDLGVEPFLVASSVIGLISQRMIRRICPDCQHIIEAPVTEQIAYEKETGEKRSHFPYGTGCKTCSYTGYRGRVGIFEVLSMSDAIKTLVYNQASGTELRQKAISEGMITMLNDGMNKVKMGITTPSEIVRAAYTTR